MNTEYSKYQLQRRQDLVERSVWEELKLMAHVAAESDPTLRPRKMMGAVAESSSATLATLENLLEKVRRWVHAARFVERNPGVPWPAPELLENHGRETWRFEWAGLSGGNAGFPTMTVSVGDWLGPLSSKENPVELAKDEPDLDTFKPHFQVTVELGEPYNHPVQVGVGWSIKAGVIGLWPRRS